MKRIGSKNKFLTCFRPGFHIEEMILDDGFSKSATILKIDPKEFLNRSVSDCSAFAAGTPNSDTDEASAAAIRPLSRRKSFSRAVKAIVSDLFRGKDRKNRSRGSDFSTADPDGYDSIRKEFDSSSSSSSFSPSSNSGSDSENPSTAAGTRRTRKPDPESNRRRSGDLTVFLLLLVCLAVTVLGGKLLGVALTPICLYLMPRRRGFADDSRKGEERRSPEKVRSSETEYRKQSVVMEGMLRRSNRRLNLK
ncbi:hypothetical protein LINPERPRIM_LOCUS45358 [Linum perenne]